LSNTKRPKHALAQFFSAQPLSLLQFLAARIDYNDWRTYVDTYVQGTSCNDGTSEELLSILRFDLTAFPDLSVDAYDAVCAIRFHYDYGFAPQRTAKPVLEAFGLALAIQSELRGIVVADSSDERLERLIEFSNDIGPACLCCCGEFVGWIRVHLQGHTWAGFGAMAQATILGLAAAQMAETALDEAAEDMHRLMAKEPEAAAWRNLIANTDRAIRSAFERLLLISAQ